MPGPGYYWVDGYWNFVGGRYAWVGGYWALPPYAGGYWVAHALQRRAVLPRILGWWGRWGVYYGNNRNYNNRTIIRIA